MGAIHLHKDLAFRISLPMALVRLGFLPQGQGGCKMKFDSEYYAMMFVKIHDAIFQPKNPYLDVTEILKEIKKDALADAKKAVIAVLNANGSPSVGVAIIKAIEALEEK